MARLAEGAAMPSLADRMTEARAGVDAGIGSKLCWKRRAAGRACLLALGNPAIEAA